MSESCHGDEGNVVGVVEWPKSESILFLDEQNACHVVDLYSECGRPVLT